MQKKLWMWQGGLALLTVLGPSILGFWLNSRLASAEQAASRRDDSAVIFRQAHAEAKTP
jgi:hypothetical protein